jgi:protein-S-isoprenylcysteine O-methyltransferase Ste14
MYVSLTLMYLGEAGLLAQVWPLPLLLLVLVYLNWILIPFEEARLWQAFGNAYKEYCAQVRRWL